MKISKIPFLHSTLARVSDLEFGSVASFMSLASGLLVDFLDIVQQGHQSYQSPASNFRRRREARMPFGAIVSAAPAERPRCKKLPEFVGVSGSGGAAGCFQPRPTNRPTTARAKCVRWNWKIGSKHHIPSPGRPPGRIQFKGRWVDRWSRSHRRQSQSTWRTS